MCGLRSWNSQACKVDFCGVWTVFKQTLKYRVMRTNEPKTPLLALMRALTPDERQWLADHAGTSVVYLYSLASCQRQSCRTPLALKIVEGVAQLREARPARTRRDMPEITVETLATMCEACE